MKQIAFLSVDCQKIVKHTVLSQETKKAKHNPPVREDGFAGGESEGIKGDLADLGGVEDVDGGPCWVKM